ncbi:hypothetical protein [Deinococcus maricopensis]|uniref:DUF885 domain-containing protein n=1 Tax=Deinococcus maricopensis (strain DSM 21211 / LMG 22137 / NRRL B-23946 / LB-34) TaxID=709986 RepID=E8U740_DEIML|nr:hypothetical protein [Deinococcus maricopensis]ADV66879.1 hypothetical protein Deima_1228 [Deinococcus maricopensis DSM 21211]
MTTVALAERYVRLAHAIDAHAPGYIDGYGGPEAWADRTARDPAALRAEAEALLADVAGVEDAERRAFLTAQVRAMVTITRTLGGEVLPYVDEVRGLFDIDAPREPEATFEAALRALDAALPGAGSLAAREAALRERLTLREDLILPLADVVLAELRGRARALFPLPDGEDFSVQLVRDKPWGGYNWPLGHYRSRIDINTDLPVLLTALPDLMAHEGYPGHHTEHAVKEALLADGEGWDEFRIQLINAPECVVSEGIAVRALGAVMGEDELRAWLTGDLAARAGIDPDDVRAHLAASEARQGLLHVSGNAALRLHADGASEEEVVEYLRTYGLRSEEQARKNLSFMQNPMFRAYLFTYSVGGTLLDALFRAEDRRSAFQWLLTRPVTPGAIAARAGVAAGA